MLHHPGKSKVKNCKKLSKKESSKRRVTNKNKSQSNASQETLKRLNDLSSFLDNGEIS